MAASNLPITGLVLAAVACAVLIFSQGRTFGGRVVLVDSSIRDEFMQDKVKLDHAQEVCMSLVKVVGRKFAVLVVSHRTLDGG